MGEMKQPGKGGTNPIWEGHLEDPSAEREPYKTSKRRKKIAQLKGSEKEVGGPTYLQEKPGS